MNRPWVVLKYGGTSVARPEQWEGIAARVRELAPSARVWVVASALAGVSNLLEQAVEEALAGGSSTALDEIRARHDGFVEAAGLKPAELPAMPTLLAELDGWIQGVRLTGEATARLRARILATGELLSTRLGHAALAAAGLEVRWIDARTLLESEGRGDGESDYRRFLDARVRPRRRRRLAEQAAGDAAAVLTQGFIARTVDGETCLLGRGGSDTSAALFAAMLDAERLEIWSDVHGLFTADPRSVPSARLIRHVGHREAQELAAMGARVLHPRCIEPAAWGRIPIALRSTLDPHGPGTTIEATDEQHPAVTAVTCRRGVTLLTLSTIAMWEAPGFLARVFAPFEENGVSVDLVATSQSAISVTLDRIPEGVRGRPYRRLKQRLEGLGTLREVQDCAVVSVVGRRIRTALNELGPAMAVFHEKPVHLISDSSEDLNLSFVVDGSDAAGLVARLHERLFADQEAPDRLGPTWEALEGRDEPQAPAWWRERVPQLIELAGDGRAHYVYHRPTIRDRARELGTTLTAVDELFYSMKANPHPEVLRILRDEGFGFECVSLAEVERAREVLGDEVPILFTPNFCPPEEYAAAVRAGAEIVVDGPEPLRRLPELFAGREIGLRIDPGFGAGHHEKVTTAGGKTKFGLALDDLPQLERAAGEVGAIVVGLHAHVGSGIRDAATWARTFRLLAALRATLTGVRWIDVGGGFGVPERPGQRPLDLAAVQRAIGEVAAGFDGLRLRIEPGRYLVSEAGVLVSPVTQVRRKGAMRFVGLAAGMNALIRPALYGAWHGIHNLTRVDEPGDGYWTVVGPICESGDLLGRDRLLPRTEPGDVMLIENAGAYGAVMASSYNLRDRVDERLLD